VKLYAIVDNGGGRVGAETANGDIVDLLAASGNDARFASMLNLIEAGEAALGLAREINARAPARASHKRETLRFSAPIPRPPKLRGYSVFERHIRQSAEGIARRLAAGAPDPEAAYRERRKALNLDALPGPGWGVTPAYYYMDTYAVAGHDNQVAWPSYSNWIDYELELVAVIGRAGRDISQDDANSHIFGYTILNDLSARDEQLKCMATSLGPAKGKDFEQSNVMGPCIVTADEIADPYALKVEVRVNDEVWSTSTGAEAHFRYNQCIAYASQAQTIHAGEMFSTGTFPNCSSLELQRIVKKGDVIELEVEKVGVLRTQIV